MKRDEILDEAKRLTTGAPESFAKVGIVWEQIIGVPVSAADVALMMSVVVIFRATESPTKADNWVDLAGYAALGGEIAGAVTPGGVAETHVSPNGWHWTF